MDQDEIFTWQDGAGAERKGDPLALLRLLNCGSPKGDVNVLLDMAEAADERTAVPGAKALAALVCRTFRLGDPWDDDRTVGVVERRWRSVLDAFLGCLEKNAPPAETTPTSPPSSAPTPCDSPAPNASDSPSTSTAA